MRWIGILAVAVWCGSAIGQTTTTRPNVLFIAVDDLRTSLGCYGDSVAKTPNIDALAKRGMLFERAYCQQAVCNPSRQSLLSGRRPDSIKVWNLNTHFRKTAPDVVPLPEFFKNAGYYAVSLGKIYHGERPMADPQSWSEPERFEYDRRMDDYQLPENKKPGKTASMEFVEAADNAYSDGQVADAAVAELMKDRKGQPLFLAVGFKRPHLPFIAPKKYLDMYPEGVVGPAANPIPDASIPKIALHPSQELRGYSDVPDVGEISKEQEVALRRGYYACVSYTDALVGQMMAALEKSGKAENTVVVFWADHGYHLGEKGLWCKITNYELDTRVPMLISVPRMKGGVTSSLAELLDIYPTLVDVCGLDGSGLKLEGVSLKPVLMDPSAKVKDVAHSQFQRPFRAGGAVEKIGYTARTDGWRYVEWRDKGAVIARELYDEKADPAEMKNLAETNVEKVHEMAKLLPR